MQKPNVLLESPHPEGRPAYYLSILKANHHFETACTKSFTTTLPLLMSSTSCNT